MEAPSPPASICSGIRVAGSVEGVEIQDDLKYFKGEGKWAVRLIIETDFADNNLYIPGYLSGS